MRSFDSLFEHYSRLLAKRTSRRSVLAGLGKMLTGTTVLPLLPVDRGSRASASDSPDASGKGVPAKEANNHGNAAGPAPGAEHSTAAATSSIMDPQSCDYWRYCAIDGFLCSCCGGSTNMCPPGTTPSPITWIGTCSNPADGRNYIVSYNDCCGKTSCGNCECNRNEREKPMYEASRNNDLNWCMANADANYHCSVSVILGVSEQ